MGQGLPLPCGCREREPQPRLVLHFDINETIMVGDPAGGDTFEETLNKVLSKVAFVRRKPGGPAAPELQGLKPAALWRHFTWHDGSELDGRHRADLCTSWERPRGCKSFHEEKLGAKSFTEKGYPGAAWRPRYEELRKKLQDGAEGLDERLVRDSRSGTHLFLLPAFFHTIRALKEQGRDFVIVVRTFGSDGPGVKKALEAWADGKFPKVPCVPEYTRPAMYKGRYAEADGSYSLARDGPTNGASSVLPENLALREIQDGQKCLIIQDHYDWWKAKRFMPEGGKPLWLPLDGQCRHIFFDDNIHNDREDSIVAARMETEDGRFVPLSGEATRRLQGVCLVRVPTMLPILNQDWFLEQIARCEERVEREFTAREDKLAFLKLRDRVASSGSQGER